MLEVELKGNQMSKLLDKILSAGSVKLASVLDDSAFFNARDVIPTDLPILNIAFSGNVDGGLVPGLTILAGESKSFKTLLGLYCMKAYFKKYPDAIAIVYDTEFSLTPAYLKSIGLDASRIIHVPIEHLEQMKFDMVKRLEQIERGDKVFFLVDSLGAVSSKKEVEDALEEKSVADMTRAKAIRSLLRIITPHLTMKDLPCVVINHIYQSMAMYGGPTVGGGTAVMYSANQVFIIGKSQEKDSSDKLIGWNFTINITKSRFVREKSKLPFQVTYKGGVSKYSGLLDIAIESKHLVQPKKGKYQRVDMETGEILPEEYSKKTVNKAEVWEPILACAHFKKFVEDKFQLSSNSLVNEEDDEELPA